MASISPESARLPNAPSRWLSLLEPRQMWASLSIVVIWLAVLFDAVFGPDIVTSSGGAAGTATRVPSAIVVAFFAFLATRYVARYGLGSRRTDD